MRRKGRDGDREKSRGRGGEVIEREGDKERQRESCCGVTHFCDKINIRHENPPRTISGLLLKIPKCI